MIFFYYNRVIQRIMFNLRSLLKALPQTYSVPLLFLGLCLNTFTLKMNEFLSSLSLLCFTLTYKLCKLMFTETVAEDIDFCWHSLLLSSIDILTFSNTNKPCLVKNTLLLQQVHNIFLNITCYVLGC